MNIEEYIEEDEEPPLLLSSRPSHGKYVQMCVTYRPGGLYIMI